MINEAMPSSLVAMQGYVLVCPITPASDCLFEQSHPTVVLTSFAGVFLQGRLDQEADPTQK